MTPAWNPPSLGMLRGPDAAVIKAIFTDLQRFLNQPTFPNGINLGDGAQTYDTTDGFAPPVEVHLVIVDSTTDTIVVDP